MWTGYTSGMDAVVVQSNWGRLKHALRDAPETVTGRRVEYVDLDEHRFRGGALDELVTHKCRSFAGENELRLWVVNPAYSEEEGIFVAVDARSLMEMVYLSPKATATHCEEVRKLLAHYGLAGVVVQPSSLAE